MKRIKLKFILLLIAVAVAVIVTTIFIFFGNYKSSTSEVTPISITEQNTLEEFTLAVPKLGITAPVLVDIDPTDEKVYDQKLAQGVAHMIGSALPGSAGNTFVYGHSSAETKSEYSDIFAKLNDLNENDEILISYNKQNYKYVTNSKKIVEKDDFSILDQPKDKNLLTLMTCWPVGTSDKRLVIQANLNK